MEDIKKTDIFPGVNLKSPIVIFYIIFFFLYFFMFIFFAYIVPLMWIKLILIVLSLVSPLTIIYAFTSKVMIGNDTVTKKSLFGSKSIKFNEIELYGVYVQDFQIAMPIQRDEYNKTFWFGIKVIYISKRKELNIYSFKQKESMRFHYSENTFEKIEKGLGRIKEID
jgi:prepilin signal peptidase PulO-like enzyme (type II secretory pathway)